MKTQADSLTGKLSKQLDQRLRDDHLRTLPSPSPLFDFTSNDYLGLARSPELFEAIQKTMENGAAKLNGATGSRLLSGNSDLTMRAESELARRFHGEAALILNSGYVANIALLSSLPSRGDTLVYDERVHASIKDGGRLSLAHRFSFRHNDLNDLDEKLRTAKGQRFIVVESIYSMDGDESPLKAIGSLAEKYDAALVVDEAHSTGVCGDGGSGIAVLENIHEACAARVYTFGKAMGVHGACVVGSKALIDYLINYSRPFIYTTALPPHSIVSIQESFKFLDLHPELPAVANQRVQFYGKMSEGMIASATPTTIQTCIIPGNSKVRAAASELAQRGFDVRPILSPTVKEGQERLRICLHTFNTEQQIAGLVNALRTFVL